MRCASLPDGIVLEGAGDCVFDQTRKLFWLGYGPRSDAAARHAVTDTFGMDVIALELADPRFYHMDTALSALPGGEVMYRAGGVHRGRPRHHSRSCRAGRSASRSPRGRAASPPTPSASAIRGHGGLRRPAARALNERGYRVVVTPLHSFLRSGGAAFCLTLRLDRRSVAAAAPPDRAAVA